MSLKKKIENFWLKLRGMNSDQFIVLAMYDFVIASKIAGYDIYWIAEKSYATFKGKIDRKNTTSIVTNFYRNFEPNNPPRKEIIKGIMGKV